MGAFVLAAKKEKGVVLARRYLMPDSEGSWAKLVPGICPALWLLALALCGSYRAGGAGTPPLYLTFSVKGTATHCPQQSSGCWNQEGACANDPLMWMVCSGLGCVPIHLCLGIAVMFAHTCVFQAIWGCLQTNTPFPVWVYSFFRQKTNVFHPRGIWPWEKSVSKSIQTDSFQQDPSKSISIEILSGNQVKLILEGIVRDHRCPKETWILFLSLHPLPYGTHPPAPTQEVTVDCCWGVREQKGHLLSGSSLSTRKMCLDHEARLLWGHFLLILQLWKDGS